MFESIVNRLKDAYGGELPSWEYFKCVPFNKIRLNRTIALLTTYMDGLPKWYKLLLNIIPLNLGMYATPIILIIWLFVHFSFAWVILALILSIIFVKFTRNMQCLAMYRLALGNEEIYKLLVSRGAFLFYPEDMIIAK